MTQEENVIKFRNYNLDIIVSYVISSVTNYSQDDNYIHNVLVANENKFYFN
jgi:hypothetical protein